MRWISAAPFLLVGPAQVRPIHQVGQLGHSMKHIHQEPRQPNALSLAPGAYEVHPVVPVPRPHQGQAMGPDRKTARDRARAVLEQRGALERDLRCGEDLVLIVFQRGSVQEGDLRAQDVHVAGGPYVVSDDVGKPQQVVGNARADTRAARRVPPVLDVAFLELAARREQDVLSRQLGVA